jgi:ketosteroid isomerase-like protein
MNFDAMANAVDWLDAYRANNLDLMVSMYAEDATLECSCGEQETMVGKASIRSFWRDQLQRHCVPELGDLQDAGNEAKISYITPDGAVTAFFEYDWDGKITFMRCTPAT